MKLTFCLPIVLLVACGGPGNGIIGHKDSGDDSLPDLSDNNTPGDMAVNVGEDSGRPWKDESYVGIPDGGSLSGVWNNGAGTAIAVGDYATIVRSQQGGAFAKDPSTEPAGPALTAISGQSGPNVYVVGTGGAIWKFGSSDLTSTSTWTPDAPPTSNDLFAIWIVTDGMAFAGGDGILLQRTASNGYNWTALTNGPAMGEIVYGMWATLTGPGQYDVFAVGCAYDTSGCTASRIWHVSNGTVTAETAPSTVAGLFSVWGSGPTDVYAVGYSGSIIHSTGNGVWSKQDTGLSGSSVPGLLAIGGSGPDEIYATGFPDANGTLFLHKLDHTSSTWTREFVPLAAGRGFFAMTVTTSDLYMVGQDGAILHR